MLDNIVSSLLVNQYIVETTCSHTFGTDLDLSKDDTTCPRYDQLRRVVTECLTTLRKKIPLHCSYTL